MVPKDPVMLLSYVNTKLRDCYSNVETFCEEENIEREELEGKLKEIDYMYDKELNQFV